MKNKKAQSWGIDLMVAVMIFSIGILVFFIYSTNYSGEAEENFEQLSYDGEIIVNSLFSDGYPKNWNPEDYTKIGLLSEDKINESKLKYFYDIVQANYANTKNHFKTRFDYYFFLNVNMTIDGAIVEGIGKPEIDKDNVNLDSSNLVKITRFSIYKNKPVTAYVYIWEE